MWKGAFSSHFSMHCLVNIFGKQTTLEQEMKTEKLKFGNRNQSHVIAIAESKNTTHRNKLDTFFFMIPAFKILEQLFGYIHHLILWHKVATIIKAFDNQNRGINDQNYPFWFLYSFGVCCVCVLKKQMKWVGSSKPMEKAISEMSFEV